MRMRINRLYDTLLVKSPIIIDEFTIFSLMNLCILLITYNTFINRIIYTFIYIRIMIRVGRQLHTLPYYEGNNNNW